MGCQLVVAWVDRSLAFEEAAAFASVRVGSHKLGARVAACSLVAVEGDIP